MQGWATTGDANEYLKETLVRDLFIMPYGTTQSKEKMSLAVKITALWALKVPLEEMCRLSTHQRHADNHRRHVSERRLHAQLLLRNLLAMAFKSRLCHNMIPLSVKIWKHAVSPCAQAGPYPTLSNHFVFRSRKSGSGHR